MKIFYPILLMVLLTAAQYAAEPDYAPLTRLLAAHVKPGLRAGIRTNLVNYHALKTSSDFTEAWKNITTFDVSQLRSRQEKMAFYINAYNLGALKKVLDMYPTKSITARGDTVWKETAITLSGKVYSLDAIENKILRPMGDARIHFAIVCASLSCPDLRREAYTAAKLSTQLDSQTESFMNNETKGLRIEGGRVYESAIFGWFAKDFGDVQRFQKKYKKGIPEKAERLGIDYNWLLNE